MTDNVNEVDGPVEGTEDSTDGAKRRIFFATVRFKQPTSGTWPIAAWNKEHAADLVREMMANLDDAHIIEIFSEDELEKLQREAAAEEAALNDVDVPSKEQLN